jgi:hydrogenase small subunit
VNFNITRRQFLQYCAASAAALGLSQTDLLKLERALATPQTGCTSPTPSVVWMIGQACSGCQTSLLNRVIDCGGTGYYDSTQINALYGNLGNTLFGYPPFPHADVPAGAASDPVGELNVVNDVADLLVGDAVRAVVPQLTGVRNLPWADDLPGAGVAPLGPLPSPNAFPNGFITLEFLTTVMAGAGDIAANHLNSIVNGGGAGGLFVILTDGAVPSSSATNEKFCYVFDNPGTFTAPSGFVPAPGPVTMADAIRWMGPHAAAIISVGTCSSYGGIPAARGNQTGAMSMEDFLAQEGISPLLGPAGHIKVPGCPPHPDWIIYPVAHVLLHGAPPPLDVSGRPAATYGDTPLCGNCPNLPTMGTPQAAQFLGDSGCLQGLGCSGNQTFADCPVRQRCNMDDGTKTNWCVGAQGPGAPSGQPGAGIGSAQHPCQGCVCDDFPDGRSPFYERKPFENEV